MLFKATYNVFILNPFNPELRLEDKKSTIKSNLVELLTQELPKTLVLLFKKIEILNVFKGSF